MTPGPVNVWDYERLAEEKLDANAHAYFAGGAGDEVTLRDNVAAFERRKLRPRVLVDVSSVYDRDHRARDRGRDAGLARAARAAADGASTTASWRPRGGRGAGTIMCLSTAATVRAGGRRARRA